MTDQYIDLRWSPDAIRRTLEESMEMLGSHFVVDAELRNGRSVREVVYDLTDIAIYALSEGRRNTTAVIEAEHAPRRS